MIDWEIIRSGNRYAFGAPTVATAVSLGLALLQSFWFFLPAYVANPAAVLFGGGAPIDGGRVLADGGRLFGNGKTWRGFAGGVSAGVLVGVIQWGISLAVGSEWSWGAFPSGLVPIVIPPVGALLGDLLGSYVNRRGGPPRGPPWVCYASRRAARPRGAKPPGLDCYDFTSGRSSSS